MQILDRKTIAIPGPAADASPELIAAAEARAVAAVAALDVPQLVVDAVSVQSFADTEITYDGAGNAVTVTSGDVSTTYTYNPDGTVATDARLGVTREYSYDGAGNLVSILEVG